MVQFTRGVPYAREPQESAHGPRSALLWRVCGYTALILDSILHAGMPNMVGSMLMVLGRKATPKPPAIAAATACALSAISQGSAPWRPST